MYGASLLRRRQVDTNQGEECDLGALNGVKLDTDGNPSGAGVVDCAADCRIPGG